MRDGEWGGGGFEVKEMKHRRKEIRKDPGCARGERQRQREAPV